MRGIRYRRRVGRMRGTVEEPAGLRYADGVLDTAEEARLLERLGTLAYDEVRMHGQAARRVVRHYGLRYDFSTFGVEEGEPVPDWLQEPREKAAALLGHSPEDLVETLVTRYPSGATIGWHRDAPVFGDVVGISLASPCSLRFQRGRGDDRRVFELELAPRSAYVLAGAARVSWQHSIPPVAAERYSLTFRTLRRRHSVNPTGATDNALS
jgi:DNA oxidative demethylase